ncbi:MAG TPA: alginate export family protein, partial [Novosphingobium sp.]|nr:alginate export family protein [Novosphingobium sp.]
MRASPALAAPLAAALALLAPAAARADPPAESWQPPVLTPERYNEDWSSLADPAGRTGHWTEAFKYIPLDGTGSAYLTTGGELRLRDETYHANLWGQASAPDNGYLWARLLPYADLHVGQLRAFVQPVLGYAVGVRPAPSAIDQTRADLLQAFADVDVPLGGQGGGQGGASLRLRAGREMVGLGTERLVGTRYGPNLPLAFDGGRAIFHTGAFTLNAFYLLPVEAGPNSFDDHSSPTRRLWGAYATQAFGAGGVDLYYLGYRNSAASFQQGRGRELRHTLGLRWFGTTTGRAAGWHWNMEGMAQFGRFADSTIGAWSIASEVGHRFAGARLHPDFTLRANIASGDRS